MVRPGLVCAIWVAFLYNCDNWQTGEGGQRRCVAPCLAAEKAAVESSYPCIFQGPHRKEEENPLLSEPFRNSRPTTRGIGQSNCKW